MIPFPTRAAAEVEWDVGSCKDGAETLTSPLSGST